MNLIKTEMFYVFCRVGYNSYVALKILKAYGFKVYNITGGFIAIQELVKFLMPMI